MINFTLCFIFIDSTFLKIKNLPNKMTNLNQEAAYKLAFQRGVVATALISRDGHFINVNDSFSKLVEYSELELLRKKFQEITDPADVVNDEEESRRIADGKIESYEMIKSYITKTKRLIKVKLRVDGLKDSSGEFICFIAQVVPLVDNKLSMGQQTGNIVVDIKMIKFLTWLQKNHKIILLILSGLISFFGFMHDKILDLWK